MERLNLRLAILYEQPDAPPLRLVTIDNQDLLLAAAKTAHAEAEERADQIQRSDLLLGEMQVAEADRIRRLLSLLTKAVTSAGSTDAGERSNCRPAIPKITSGSRGRNAARSPGK